jgi:hypothetical protein
MQAFFPFAQGVKIDEEEKRKKKVWKRENRKEETLLLNARQISLAICLVNESD